MSKAKTSKAASNVASTTEQNQQTLVTLYDVDDISPHHCGYCNQNGNISIGMQCETMKIEDYQSLIDRGWRRSGTYIYKPVMDKTCCPLYTIKCDSLNFELSKSQKKCLKTMKKFLEKNEIPKKSPRQDVSTNTANKIDEGKTDNTKTFNNTITDTTNKKQTHTTNAKKVIDYFLSDKYSNEENADKTPNQILNIPKLKSKHKRLFRKLKVLKEKNLLNENSDVKKYLKRDLKTESELSRLEDYLRLDSKIMPLNNLEVKLVRSWPPSKEFQDTLQIEHEIYTKYQMRIHKDAAFECSMSQFQRFLCISPLLSQSYTGPLAKAKNKSNDSMIGYGSFHQQYILNGKIIAVGVIDILNNCVSSVYFFYDPDYQFLNMGTYSALREIEFTRELSKMDENLKWYYLGFYAHTCKKMRYKGLFKPSFLLCPEAYTWHPIEYCFPLLEKQKYNRFENETTTIAEKNAEDHLDYVQIRVKFKEGDVRICKFNEFCKMLKADFVPQFSNLIRGYCKLFGEKFSRSVLIKF